MLKKKGLLFATVIACTFATGCKVRLGGAKPEGYNAVGLKAPAGASATDVATRIRSAEGDLVLISADRDSAWFAEVATQAGLKLNGPGHTGAMRQAFLTRLEVLGDTALMINVNNGGRLHVQDALFKVDKERNIDLMLVSFAEVTSVREGVRALLNYIATDVGGTSALVLGIESPSRAVADSSAVLLRAAFTNALECDDRRIDAPAGGLGMILFYGPEARLTCSGARVQAGDPNAVVARVVVGR
ncbi:MAG: hypothetical protein ABIV28_01295 [Longimicrobiales bacterium]